MCNPTKNPPPGTTPSAPAPPSAPTTARSLPPLSPASTLSGMSPASSGQPPNSSSTPNNPNSNNESPPMLKLVSSLRNSGDIRLPHGQESRDDRNWKQRRMRRQSPPESNNDDEDDDDDDDDEIPSLVDEAPHQLSTGAESSDQSYANINHEDDDFAAWQKHRQQQQQQPSPPKRRTSPRESFKETTKSTPATTPGSAQTTPQEGTKAAALPFFVLDYMIEDLVPKHQNAEELADLLNDKETALSPKRSISFSPLRKTKSCGLVGWSNCKKPEGTETNHHDTNAADPIRTPTKPSAHPTPSTSESLDTMPPLPITPKSSNRKHSKMQGFSSLPSLDETSALFVPRNLNDSLKDCEGDRTDSSQPKLKPKVPQHSPHSPLSVVDSDNHESTSSLTKKSASCPQLHRGEDDPRAVQLRRRAQEQHDRRERRNKLTVVQRSLTLAQGWNNKGLIAAGKATRSHEQHQLWKASLGCWDNALEIYRSLLGESHERVADVQNNRGIALGKLGFVSEALEALGMALDARKKQQQRRAAGPPTNTKTTLAASTSAAIVSTLHNIANVFRDAGNPSVALGVLVEAQNTLLEMEAPPTGTAVLQHRHYCWHQSARLSTAIGHVYYELESWRDAREAYVEALEVYQTLPESLARQSSVLGWDDRCDAKRAELLHHQKLIQKEVDNLKTDLDELDRCQQAKVGGRARLLQARRQQQQQQQQQQKHYEASNRRLVPPPQQQQQQPPQTPQQQQQQPQSIFGIVSSLRT